MMDDHATLDNFSFLGTWWIPDEPDNKVSGTLTFNSDEGVSLKLYATIETGSFDHPFSKQIRLGPGEFGRTFGPPVIHGIHDNGRLCTVFGAQHISDNLGGGPARRAEYRGTALILGRHVGSPHEAIFNTVHIRLTHLEEWLGDSPFSADHLGEGILPEGLRLTYRYPEVFTARLPTHGLTVSTRPQVIQSANHADCSVAYQHRNDFTIRSETPWTPEQCFILLSGLRVLLTLLIDSPLYFNEVSLGGDPVMLTEGEFTPDLFTMYFPQPFRRLRKNLYTSDMLFTFADIRARFSAILAAWLDHADSLRSVYELMENVFFGARMQPHVGFLTLTQAFETYHRDQIGGEYMDKEKYERVRSALGQAIPPEVEGDHREALKTRIRFGSAYSMRKRIDTAMKLLGEPVANEITRKKSEFGRKIADTRNYLTHRDESSRGLVIAEADLAAGAEKFRYFFTVLLMRTLGIAPEETVAAIRRNYHKKWVLDWDGL